MRKTNRGTKHVAAFHSACLDAGSIPAASTSLFLPHTALNPFFPSELYQLCTISNGKKGFALSATKIDAVESPPVHGREAALAVMWASVVVREALRAVVWVL